jgi:triosephosphate isomerase
VEKEMSETIILANWKMNKTLEEAKVFVRSIIDSFSKEQYVRIVILAPYPYIGYLSDMSEGTTVSIGAENMFHDEWGKYTGEVSAPMLASVGGKYVMLGHSFRREYFGEDDSEINQRVLAALRHDITPIVCIGETIEEKNSGVMREVFERQVKVCFRGVRLKKDQNFWVIYEPRWAIGTGITPPFEEIGRTHLYIKELLTKYYGAEIARGVPVVYGGSVQSKNVFRIYSQDGVDGVGFGGCSLVLECFSDAIISAIRAKKV